jgi:hypothetical protein
VQFKAQLLSSTPEDASEIMLVVEKADRSEQVNEPT